MTRVAVSGTTVLTVAGKTIAHIQFAVLIDFVHRFDRAVAICALEAFANMPLVREESMIGQGMDALPFDRFTRVVSFCQLNDVWLVNGDDGMAIHAHIHCGHRGVPGVFHRAVTVHARYMVIACVDLVAEGNRLGRRVSLVAPGPHKQRIAKHQCRYGVKQAEDLSAHRTSSELVKNFANSTRLHNRAKLM